MNKPTLRPLLRWAGSKRKLVPILSEYWSESYNRYVEPFMGSACLYFAIQPKRALLGDLNSDLVATYKVVRSHPEVLADALSQMTLGPEKYYALRSQAPHSLSKVEAAARFIYLNRFCFNGLFRTNTEGKFNVPYGGEKTGKLPTSDYLKSISKALYKCSIKHCDYTRLLSQTKEGDFVYLDPPFAVANRRVFKQYGPENFGIDDLNRLARELDRLNEKKISFVLSYAYCKEALHLFKKWPKRKVFVRRNIAGFTTSRRVAAELIVSNI